MLASPPNASGKWMALLGLALIACGGRTADLGDGGTSSGGSGGGSGSGGGGFPYSGPSCSATVITPACWSCLQSTCSAFVGCIDNACSGYFNCYCACPVDDEACTQACVGNMSPACSTCVQNNETCVSAGCNQQCQATMTSGGGGTSSSGGSSVTSECTTMGTTCTNGTQLQACLNLENGACTGAYYQVGGQMVLCTSCTDTTACQQAAMALCQ
jgi:hypothetical protein